MACCLYFFQCSRTWSALLVPIFAVFARLSPGHGAFLIPITFIFLSTIVLLTFSKKKQSMPTDSLLKEAENESLLSPQGKHQPTLQAQVSYLDSVAAVSSVETGTDTRKGDEREVHDLYSESESMDQFSSTSSEDHSSDIEQRLDCSDDGSISDEESLFEIEIPSVCPEKDKDLRWNVKCCKLSQDSYHQEFRKEFWAEMNEEDNMIEIDIMMGSIKC